MRNFYFIMLLMCMGASPAVAAPFCIVMQGISPQCDYVDANQCRARAAQLQGMCTANPSELILRPGSGKFCMVDSSRNSFCSYSDRENCNNDASRNGGVCIENIADAIQPDPYQLDANRNY